LLIEKVTMVKRRPLNVDEILHCADLYKASTGKWPSRDIGPITDMLGETWAGVDHALREGLRSLEGGSSLAQLLAERRQARNIHRLLSLTEEQILAWADAHHQRKGIWPTAKSGLIPGTECERWSFVNAALQSGSRGLPGGSSLAQLLAAHRGVRNRKALPTLSEEQILTWADAHLAQTGTWPHNKSGPIKDAPGETWLAVTMALGKGQRGLPGGSSLALLLAERRDADNIWNLPTLSIQQILSWADAHHQQTGKWPIVTSGAILEAPRETWLAVNKALTQGMRGLPGGSSLARLLQAERGVRYHLALPCFSKKEILAWATSHHACTGHWPTRDSGVIAEAPEETWSTVDTALVSGLRGLKGGSSLAQLLAKHGKKRNNQDLPPLSKNKILAWADAHHKCTGKWPNVNSGMVADAPGENWRLIDHALRNGKRSLERGSSLARLLEKKRGLRNTQRLPPLTEAQILDWAELHCQREGTTPKYNSGLIADASGETWAGVDYALRYGKRGLPGKSSLAKLLARHRGQSSGKCSKSTSRGSDSLQQLKEYSSQARLTPSASGPATQGGAVGRSG
jgi:hypothetical protein